jgi:hypothetical protein
MERIFSSLMAKETATRMSIARLSAVAPRSTLALPTNATSIRLVCPLSPLTCVPVVSDMLITVRAAVFNPVGGAQTRLCIPRYQNSGTQGPILREFIKQCGMAAGDKMLIKVEGGCAGRATNTSPPPKRRYIEVPDEIPRALARQAATSNIAFGSANGTLRNPNGDGSLQYVSLEFDDLVDGVYNVQVSFDNADKVSNVTVVDEDGDDGYISEYACRWNNSLRYTLMMASTQSVLAPRTGISVHFTVSNAQQGLGAALIAYASQAVSISMTGTATPVSATVSTMSSMTLGSSASSTVAASSARSGSAYMLWKSLLGTILVGVFVFMFASWLFIF